ncbi:MAG: sigma-70 family RNA polymerase sigma factor [Desulfatitalea sp.]
MDPIEAQLLEKAQRGNAFAFEEIVRRYQRQVYATAVRIVRRHDLADDVAQDAFLKAYQALRRFDTRRPFGPWIRRIAANLAINHVRSPEAREDGLPEDHDLTPSPRAGPLGALLEGEAQDVLAKAMAGLPPEQRAVFALRVFEELSYQEIAESLGVPVGTVMSRLSRARDRLHQVMAPYLGASVRPARGVS